MWPDSHYYQRQLFYNYRWTKEMEQAFVDSLLDHATHGQFCFDWENRHAVHCSLRQVNRSHGTKVTMTWAFSRVARLRERYEVFNWLLHQPGVIWNCTLKFVTAADRVWEDICQEKKLARWYINAYEDPFEDLCILFGEPVPNEQVFVVPATDPTTIEAEDVVPEEPTVVDVDAEQGNTDCFIVIPPSVVNILSDSSDSSDEFWRVIEGGYASDSDLDSVPALPGIPRLPPNTTISPPKSPSSHFQ